MSEQEIEKQILESVECMHAAMMLGEVETMLQLLPIILQLQQTLVTRRSARHAITIH